MRPVSAVPRVVEVVDDRLLDVLLGLPAAMAGADPGFVAPIIAWQRRRVRALAGTLGEGRLRLFLAFEGDRPVGSVSVLQDADYQAVHKDKVAFFGFFWCPGSPDTAALLLDHAADVARAAGATVLRGPRDLSRVEAVGLTVEGFNSPPPFLASHSPAHLPALVEAQGFVGHHDVLAYEIALKRPDGGDVPLPDKLAQKAASVDIAGLELRPLRWARWRKDLTLAHTVFVDAFRDVPDNTPMSREQFVGIGGGLLAVTQRHMLQLATVHGEAAGFALCFPEVNEALRHAQGRLLPTGAVRVLRAARTVRTASFKLLGVLPAHRGSGLHAALIAAAIQGVRRAGYSRLEASLIDARNAPMRAIVEGAGMQIYRRYRIYERAL